MHWISVCNPKNPWSLEFSKLVGFFLNVQQKRLQTIGDQKSRISALEETLSAQQTVIGSQTDVIKRLQAQMEEVYNAIPCLKSKFQESQSPLVLEIAKTKSPKQSNKRKREEDRWSGPIYT